MATIRISLPDDDRRRLGAVLREATDANLRQRARVVPTAHRGRRHPDTAADTSTSPRSVRRGLNAYLDRGPDGPRPRTAPGAKPTPTADLATVLRQWVTDGPAEHGLDRADWTHPELADHLLETNGVRVGKSALREFGARHGIRPHRPAYRFLRGDPVERAKAREGIAELKKGRPLAISCC